MNCVKGYTRAPASHTIYLQSF